MPAASSARERTFRAVAVTSFGRHEPESAYASFAASDERGRLYEVFVHGAAGVPPVIGERAFVKITGVVAIWKVYASRIEVEYDPSNRPPHVPYDGDAAYALAFGGDDYGASQAAEPPPPPAVPTIPPAARRFFLPAPPRDPRLSPLARVVNPRRNSVTWVPYDVLHGTVSRLPKWLQWGGGSVSPDSDANSWQSDAGASGSGDRSAPQQNPEPERRSEPPHEPRKPPNGSR